MSIEQTVAGLEGRLLAHRKLLARLLAGSPGPLRAAIGDWLDGQEILNDGQEDPGAVPGEGLALELALSDELRRIAALCEDLGAKPGDAAR